MRAGIFELGQVPDQAHRQQWLDASLRSFELAEDIGFDTVWMAEHHFSDYGIVGSVQVLAAAAAARTSRIEIGSAVTVIPFNHPVRTAEDFALLDLLSHGRVRFGAGRAYQPGEFAGLGLPMDRSRQMFEEGMDIIEMAWSQDEVSYEGEYYTIPKCVVLPRPAHKIPVYMASVTPPSFDTAAKRGWNLHMATPFSYRLYREEWLDRMESTLHDFEDRAGSAATEIERALVVPFFLASTTAKAVEQAEPHVDWFFNRVTGLSAASATPAAEVVKGYEMSMNESARTQAMGKLNFESLTSSKAVVCGDPESAIEQLREIKTRLGLTELILWFNLGGIGPEVVEESMKLAATEVLPHL